MSTGPGVVNTPEQQHLPSALLSPLHYSVRQKIQDALVAFSLANLIFIGAWFSALYDLDHGYFNKLRVTAPTLLALATNILLFATVAWFIMRARRRTRSRWFPVLCHVLILVALLFPIDFCRQKIFRIPDYQVVMFLKRPMVLVALLGGLVLFVWKHRWIARGAAVLVGILSPLALATLARIFALLLGLQHLQQHDREPVLAAPALPKPGAPRVLWIIFDETDQRIAFEQRPPTLKLPEFDRLRNESLYCTNAFPPGDATILSMPQLISGVRLSSVAITEPCDLTVKLAATNIQTTWKALGSVFGAARQLGVNTGLVGWYHPYARILENDLNYCSWYPHQQFEVVRAARFQDSLINQFGSLGGAVWARTRFASMCRGSLQDSLNLVTNETYGLMLLHLPPPHRPGIYLPDQQRYTAWGMPKTTAYFNNLALADRYLGEIRRALDSAGESERTWIVLSADHSWRESRLYDARRDLRVPYLVKPPGQPHSSLYSSQFNTVLTHDLLLAILRSELKDAESVGNWLDQHRSTEPTAIMKNTE